MIRDVRERKRTISRSEKQKNEKKWQPGYYSYKRDFQQWPPEGSTSTGGWLATNWSQSAPYNQFCPVDPTTGQRSVTGCPSTAMSIIFNFHRELNNTRLSNSDDYEHYYDSNNHYFIDDDYNEHDFLNFSQINDYLDIIDDKFNNEEELNNEEAAALTFACGIAMKQAYSSQVSGTFYHPQVVNGFRRFGFANAEMLYEMNPETYLRIQDNMKAAYPSQLCVLASNGSGHQVVVDGYNTDDEYHFNFGWGGSSNGWYSFPLANMPYNLNIFGTMVLDINNNFENYTDFEIIAPMDDQQIDVNEDLVVDIVEHTQLDGYKVYVDNVLIDSVSLVNNYTVDLSGFETGFHELTLLGYSEEYFTKSKTVNFEIEYFEDMLFYESFDNTLNDWEVNYTTPDLSWQREENQLIPFSEINSLSSCSITCPVSYSNLNEELLSSVITIPEGENAVLQFYIAYSDLYYQYPQLSCSVQSIEDGDWQEFWSGSTDNQSYDWSKVSISLEDFSGESIRLKFSAAGFSYADVSIDEIRIFTESVTLLEEESSEPIVSDFKFYPNPLFLSENSKKSSFSFNLKNKSTVSLEIFNLKGRKVESLVNKRMNKGKHKILWENKKKMPSGIYFSRLKLDNTTRAVKKIILVK